MLQNIKIERFWRKMNAKAKTVEKPLNSPTPLKKIGFKCKKNHQTWYFDSSFDTRARHSTYMKVLEYRRLSTRVLTSKYCSTDMEVLAEHKREGTRTCIYIYIGKDCKKTIPTCIAYSTTLHTFATRIKSKDTIIYTLLYSKHGTT